MEELCPTSHNIEVPVISRTDYTFMDIQEDWYVSLMDDSSNIRDYLSLPEDNIGREIEQAFNDGKELVVTIISAIGKEKIISYKTI